MMTDSGDLLSGMDDIDADTELDQIADVLEIFRRHKNQIAVDIAALKQRGE